MAAQVNVHEAKTHLSRLLVRVEQGEEVVIARAGKPVAKLVPHREQKPRRQAGGWEGVHVPDSFYEPLPEDIMRYFRGEVDDFTDL